jgi:stearoyl-CoA desaturase (delta-9 desaturase)
VDSAEKDVLKVQSTERWVPPQVTNNYHVPVIGEKYTGVLGDNFKHRPWYQRLNWFHVPLLALSPILALYGLATWTPNWKTLVFTFIFYYFSGFGITAGYHRLWAHKCYKASYAMQLVLAFAGTAAVEGSIRWWSRDHRAHHRYVDTEKDPYSAIKGFWYAHIGWMIVKQDKEKIGKADISDLDSQALIRFQHKYYLPLMLFAAFGFPSLVCGLGWGDYYGGYFIAGMLRLVGVHHSTFFVNSLAHYAGAATYTDAHTARNSVITALLTLGEGYHNFHHEFPSDYRNGIEWYQWDPTKVLIKTCALLGLAHDLKYFPHNEIEKGKLQMRQKNLDAEKRELHWGPDPATLPVVTKEDVNRRVAAGEMLVVLDGFVLNLTKFATEHPGGKGYITSNLGEDVTEKFKTAVYKHSNAAINLSATFRVARVQGYWS